MTALKRGSKRAVCFHEAGHVVAGLAVGLCPTSATVERGRAGYEGLVRYDNGYGLLPPRDRIACSVAGVVAESVHGWAVDIERCLFQGVEMFNCLEQARECGETNKEDDVANSCGGGSTVDFFQAYADALEHVGPVESFIPPGKRKTKRARGSAWVDRCTAAERLVVTIYNETRSYLQREDVANVTLRVACRLYRGPITGPLYSYVGSIRQLPGSRAESIRAAMTARAEG